MSTPSTDVSNQLLKGYLFAWVVWGFGAFFYFIAIFQRVAPSVMVSELMRDLGLTGSGLGNMSGIYFWGYALVQLPTGMLVDGWGPRRLLCCSAVICGIGGLLFAFADTSTMAYGGRLIVGLGAGFGFVTTLKIAMQWFPPHRFALLSGLTVMIGTAGGLTGQAPLAWAIGEWGWRYAMAGAGIVSLALGAGIGVVIFLRRRPEKATHDPRLLNPSTLLSGLTQILKHRQTWIITGAGFTTLGTMFSFGGLWGVPYLMVVHGFSHSAAAASMSLMLLGWGIGGPVIGWISDHFKRRRLPFIVCNILALTTISTLLYAPGLPHVGINVLLFVYGLFSGSVILLFPAVREHNVPAVSGTAIAMVNMGIIFSGVVLPPLIGWLLDRNWEGVMEAGSRVYSPIAFEHALWLLPLSGVLAVVMGLLMGETHARVKEAV
jgi:predicted MFS family arabinose efflux permease